MFWSQHRLSKILWEFIGKFYGKFYVQYYGKYIKIVNLRTTHLFIPSSIALEATFNEDSACKITASGWQQSETFCSFQSILVHFIFDKFHDAKPRELNRTFWKLSRTVQCHIYLVNVSKWLKCCGNTKISVYLKVSLTSRMLTVIMKATVTVFNTKKFHHWENII